MNDPDDLKLISRYLNKNHVLALCAHDEDDIWSANCFYVTDVERMCLYFMTELKTRHGALMQKNPQIVGTIATQPKTVALIKGIQYRGTAIILEGEAEKAARASYCKHFPVAAAMKAPIWQLQLDEVKMTDNALGFGKKLLWQRNA